MAVFEHAVAKTLAHEGGAKFTDDPADRGGATKFGISQRAYPEIDIRNLTEAQAREIYKRDYWDRIRGDDIESQAMAESIFDSAVNMGVRTSSRMAQIAASIRPADGIIGSNTIRQLNDTDEALFLAMFTISKIARYAAICNRNPSQRRFLLGWVNRSLGGEA